MANCIDLFMRYDCFSDKVITFDVDCDFRKHIDCMFPTIKTLLKQYSADLIAQRRSAVHSRNVAIYRESDNTLEINFFFFMCKCIHHDYCLQPYYNNNIFTLKYAPN